MDNLNISHKELTQLATYIDGDIALIHNFTNLSSKAVRVDNMIFIGFCIKGKGSFKLNNTQYKLSPNDMLICSPNTIVDSTLVSLDFEGRLFGISSHVTEMITTLSVMDSWNILQLINTQPVWRLTPETIRIFLLYYDLFKAHLDGQCDYRYHKERMYSLLQAFTYDLHQVMNRFIHEGAQPSHQGNSLFTGFLKILTNTYPRNRKIAYYADLLNTSPKYLSVICKQQCGKTASEIINQHVFNDIRTMLKDPQKSIKEIAYELDFPNISFLGTYIKRYSGMSPKEYRKYILGNKD